MGHSCLLKQLQGQQYWLIKFALLLSQFSLLVNATLFHECNKMLCDMSLFASMVLVHALPDGPGGAVCRTNTGHTLRHKIINVSREHSHFSSCVQ